MNREDFLSLMISHLEEMQLTEGQDPSLLNPQSHENPHLNISTILTKLTFDYPLLEENQIKIFHDFLMLFGTPNYEDEENYKITMKLKENMKYMRSSSSYSHSKQISYLFEGFYLYFPLALLTYGQTRLSQLFEESYSEQNRTWDFFFQEVFSLFDLSLPSTFASHRLRPLTDSTLHLILKTLTHIVQLLTPLDHHLSSSDITSLRDYYSHSVQSVISQTDPLLLSSEMQYVLNQIIELFSSLMFLLRDLFLLKDEFTSSVFPLLFQQVINPLLRIPTMQLQSMGFVIGAGVIFHLQLLSLFLLSDLCLAYHPRKADKSYQEARQILSSAICLDISTIVSCTEMIFNSLAVEKSIHGDSPGKVGQKLLESLISILSIVEVTVVKQIQNSSISPLTPPIDLSAVYLSSRLLPLLSSLLMKPLPDATASEAPSYLSLEPKLKSRLLWTLANISHLVDSSLSMYLHKIFLPLILRFETKAPLSNLLSSTTEIPSCYLVPIATLLIGSVKWGHNQTVIKSYEKTLTIFMKSHGDASPTDKMTCAIPLTEIIRNLLLRFITETIRTSSSPPMDRLSSPTLAMEQAEMSDGNTSDDRSDESTTYRKFQRAHQDWTALLRQACQLVELLALTKQQVTPPSSSGATSSLPSEYLIVSRETLASLNDLISQINSSIGQSSGDPVSHDPTTSAEEKQQLEDNSALSQNSLIQSEKKKMVYELAKLVKAYTNQMTTGSNNTKID